MVFEEIIRYSLGRRASPGIAEGLLVRKLSSLAFRGDIG
jgi:hypothetical protein